MRSGLLIAAAVRGYAVIAGSSIANIGRTRALWMTAESFVEPVAAGVAIGPVHKPAASDARRATGSMIEGHDHGRDALRGA